MRRLYGAASRLKRQLGMEAEMGSGSRISLARNPYFGLGAYVDKWPFSVTIGVQVGFWILYLGFGKGYEERI